MGHQVAREEDRQHDLGDLTGLETQRPQHDPDPRAVDGAAQAGHEGQQQKAETDDHCGVGVAAQHPMVLDQPDHRDRAEHPDRAPDQLPEGVGIGAGPRPRVREVEPVDHHQAQSVEQRRRRQQHRVGVLRLEPQDDVQAPGEDQQPGAVVEQVRRHLVLHGHPDRGVGEQHDADRQQQQRQLDASAGAGCDRDDGGHQPSPHPVSAGLFSTAVGVPLGRRRRCGARRGLNASSRNGFRGRWRVGRLAVSSAVAWPSTRRGTRRVAAPWVSSWGLLWVWRSLRRRRRPGRAGCPRPRAPWSGWAR